MLTYCLILHRAALPSILIELLKMIHGPGYDVFAKQALAQFGEDRDGQLKFEEYADMNIRFPNLLYPIFRIQNKCYQKFFGVSWWERRKTIFHEARMSMAGEDVAQKDREEQARRNMWSFRQPAKKKKLFG